jgi:hypothetical protein
LSTASIAALTTTQVAAMQTEDIAAFKTSQIVALTTTQIESLTTTQISHLSLDQVSSLTVTQQGALSTTQAAALLQGTPLILDLDGDGVKTLSYTAGVKFDLFADGRDVTTGWVSSGDGLLVLDRNHDGAINDGSELFGSSTNLASGGKAADGYVALRELDSNQDGSIGIDDAAFADLRVWIDGDSDGISDAGETKSLAELGIAKLDLNAVADLSKDNGNLVGLTSSYQTTDGATHEMADVWFVADKNQAAASDTASVDSAIAALNTQAMAAPDAADASPGDALPQAVNEPVAGDALTGSSLEPIAQAVREAVGAEVKPDLRSRVSGLAQAIGSFGNADPTDSLLTAGTRLDTSGGVAATASPASLAVASMADVMKQFDANGNLLGSQGPSASTLTKTLNLPGMQDPNGGGILSTGGK